MCTVQVKTSPTKGRNLASPDPGLRWEQQSRTNSRLARGSPQAAGAPSARPSLDRAGFVEKQPWSNRLTNRPYRRHIQCEDRLTPYPDTRLSRQGRSDRSHFALPLTDLTGKQRRSPRSDCCASHPGKVDNSKFSIGRDRKLRLARP
jgi:hypothetical protein